MQLWLPIEQIVFGFYCPDKFRKKASNFDAVIETFHQAARQIHISRGIIDGKDT